MNLTQRREGAKGGETENGGAIIAPEPPIFTVIPAKAGIQTADDVALWERGRPARKAALARGAPSS